MLGALMLLPVAAQADDAQANAQPAQQERGCGIADGAPVNQDSGTVTINCIGVSVAFAGQLAGVLTYVVQHRLDPEIVIAKLGEISGVPADDVPRNLTVDQGQAIVQSLVASGKPASLTVTADLAAPDAANYALAIATRLGMAGWNIAGSQINRAVPPGLDDIRGAVLVVRDEKKPPEMANELKKAMAAAKIFLPIISRPEIEPDAAMLWIGKRPELDAAATR